MGNDMISELPEYLITEILLRLPTKDSVKTSVLSTRWRDLWLHVPGLDLSSGDFPFPYRDIINTFTERFLEFNSVSRLEKFKMKNDHCKYNVCIHRLKKWIATAVDSGIQHLDFEAKDPLSLTDFMPMNIYKSKTLVSLKLVHVGMEYPEFDVSLPCLKIMHLENIWCRHDGPLIMEKLISGCPVLEDLTLVRFHEEYHKSLPILRVRSLTLKIFCLMFDSKMYTRSITVEIDAPGLKYLSFKDRFSDRIIVKNLSSLFKIDLDTEFGGSPWGPDGLRKRDLIRELLNVMSSVKHMIISQRTLEVVDHYSKLGPIPKFHNLSHLKAAFSSSLLQLLPTFLESCPNLKTLILVICFDSTEPERIDLTNVPRCITSTLEYIEMNKLIRNDATGIRLVQYFLENSPVLKKVKLSFTDSFKSMTNLPSDRIYKMYLTSRKLSRRCQVIIS